MRTYRLQNTVEVREALLGIRFRMLLGLQDPDPLVRGMDQDPYLSHNGAERTVQN
jgi:hypothetical protein